MNISELLTEGVHDPAIFKVIFVIGGPGSGKSYITNLLGLRALGFVGINSDVALTHLMNKAKLSLKMPPEEAPEREKVRGQAKEITANKMELAIQGRLGVVVDGTGEDFSKIKSLYQNFTELGYEAFLVVVNASLETATKRNQSRSRSVPGEILNKKWQGVQNNIGEFLNLFGNSVVIDNNGELEETQAQLATAYKKIRNWVSQAPKSSIARKWIAAHK